MSPPGGAPLSILHVFRAPVGGLFRHVRDLVGAQAARGHRVGLLCDASTGGERAADQLDELAPRLALGVHRLPMRRDPHPSDARALARAVALGRGADVVHGHGSKGGVYARLPGLAGGLIGRRRGPVRAYTPHGGSLNHRPGTAVHALYMRAERLLERGTDLFLFESAFARARFEAFVGTTNRVVRVALNGLHEAEFAPVAPAPGARDLLYLGELRTAKGVDVLLRALHRARAAAPPGAGPTLALVGSGPDEARLRALAAELGLAEAAAFHGPRAAREAFALARVLVVPSLLESLPYVVLEAAGAGLPIVSTDVGGIPEIFGPDAGRLVPAGDPEALARALTAALGADPGALAADAARLRERVRHCFSVERMTDDVLGAYAAARAAR